MNRALCSTALILVLLGCAEEERPTTTVAETPVAATSDARKLVAELYRDHDAQRSPFFQTESKERLERYFEPSLAELIWKDAVDAKGEVGALGFDPLYDSQDVEPNNLVVHDPQADASQANATSVRVPVSFESHGEKREIAYVLALTAGTWKISNIRYADGRTLRDAYQPPAATKENA